MPKYEVLRPGYYDGVIYDPEGKRRFLSTDKPLKPTPSWLKPLVDVPETAAEKKKRIAAEKAAAEADEEESKEEQVEKMSFLGEGESAVTTL